jgi:hypothetical protein
VAVCESRHGGSDCRRSAPAMSRNKAAIREPPTARRRAILVEDNFPLRSSRTRFRRLAHAGTPPSPAAHTAEKCGFGIICLVAPLELLLRRNALRARPVPDDAIVRISSMLEEPEGSAEAPFVVLDTSNQEPGLPDGWLDSCFTLKDPADDRAVEEAERLKCREATASNLVHRLDLKLRAALKGYVSVHKDGRAAGAVGAAERRRIFEEERRKGAGLGLSAEEWGLYSERAVRAMLGAIAGRLATSSH